MTTSLAHFIFTNFTEFLGGSLIFVAVIFGFLSMFFSIRSHSIRMLSLMLVAGISIYSNHPVNYFTALFIIATAVTELDFLQNLAAIIRGNKDYFSYKIEKLSKEEKKKRIEKEQKLDLALHSSQDKEQMPRDMRERIDQSVERRYEIYEKVLDKLEDYFVQKIERNVRISSKNKSIELDGIISSIDQDMVSDRLFVIKYTEKTSLSRAFAQAESLTKEYDFITNKRAKMHLVFVTDNETGFLGSEYEQLKMLADKSNTAIGFSVYTANELL